MKNLKTIFSLSVLVLISACAKETRQDNRPEWIDKPDGYFVGRCATHEKDPVAQEQCAYRRGLADIAMSKGDSADVSSKVDKKNIEVSGSIIDKWHDKSSDIMYVLIKED